MANRYSNSEFIKNIYYLIMTKLTMKQSRFIRRPIYIRGFKSLSGCDNLTTGRFCRFDLEGSKKTLYIGDNCEIGDMTHIVAYNQVDIGDNVLIASKCFISDTSHGSYKGETQHSPLTSPNDRSLICSTVKVGNNVWIGENVVIMPGVEIGSGSIIGANAVVVDSIPNNAIAVGIPAKVIKIWDMKTNNWEKVQ